MTNRQDLETRADNPQSLQSSDSDFARGLAMGITITTGIGLIQYIRGAWPFYRNNENSYLLVSSRTGKPIYAISPHKTEWLPRPFHNLIKRKNGEPVEIPATMQQIQKKR